MIKEIGSEFWDIPLCDYDNALFPEETVWFLSGRSALRAIIAENLFNSVGIPSWCCDSIIKPFLDSGIRVQFYDDVLPNTDAILVMDFFGYSTQRTWEEFDGIVICDVTHSLFTERHYDADYYFGSLRKWAGFWTGGFAWGFKKKVTFDGEAFDYISLREKAMTQKKRYIDLDVGARERVINKPFLGVFAEAEEMLENAGILPAAHRDICLARKLNVNLIKTQRRKNAKVLLESFKNISVFSALSEDDCPMFVPIMIPYRDELREYLIQKNIFCPIHWTISKYHHLSDSQLKIYKTELSLVCDQRYNECDMMRIVSEVKRFQEMRRENAVDLRFI